MNYYVAATGFVSALASASLLGRRMGTGATAAIMTAATTVASLRGGGGDVATE